MDSFEDWLSTTQHVSVQNHADQLMQLGASWDTFLSREDPQTIVDDLVKGGVPLLAASDIVQVAKRAAKQSQAPLAIFWDLENMPIPTTSSGRDVSSRLKSLLAPYGELKQFRGYASIGLNLIPQHKRSDLQLSGCILVDCPHNGRKEVADKTIIVDAMDFAMQNPSGATLCFVTGDIDYAYMLAVLQRHKQYRTIVISKGTLQSMLDVNCDMKMRWETDVLQLRSTEPAWKNTMDDLGLLTVKDTPVSTDDDKTLNAQETFEPLTANEEWIDDVQFLRTLIRREEASVGCVLKSVVGNLLRQTNPARFPHRDSVKTFLAQAIEKRVVWETGEGGNKTIRLPADETSGMFPAIPLSSQLPMPLESIPERVVVAAATRSYVIFIKWKFCPPGTTLPTNVFVQHKDSWGFLMFTKLTEAQRTVSELTWLRNGILLDWRKVDTDGWRTKSQTTVVPSTSNISSELACVFCRAVRSDVGLQRAVDGSGGYGCPECIAWQTMTKDQKDAEAQKVVKFLEWLVKLDDITVPEAILRKQMYLHKGLQCETRKWAALWIKHAIDLGHVVSFKGSSGSKTKVVCLASKFSEASRPFPPDDFDTTAEEKHLLERLWNSPGWINRLEVIKILKEISPLMSHPYLRTRVLMNAHKKELLHVSKGPYGHAVGLTVKDAELGLASFEPAATPKNSETETVRQPIECLRESDSDSSDDEESLRKFVGAPVK